MTVGVSDSRVVALQPHTTNRTLRQAIAFARCGLSIAFFIRSFLCVGLIEVGKDGAFKFNVSVNL